MRATLPALTLAILLAGCASIGGSASPTSTPSSRSAPTPPRTPRPTVVQPLAMSVPYRQFVASLCASLRRRDSATVRNQLPYYQYNSGVRYGKIGDGEGQTGDSALVAAWLTGGQVRCRVVTRDVAGHGTVLASGWTGAPGPWSLIEMDTFNGAWKINDFTFGNQAQLYAALQSTSAPTEAYRG